MVEKFGKKKLKTQQIKKKTSEAPLEKKEVKAEGKMELAKTQKLVLLVEDTPRYATELKQRIESIGAVAVWVTNLADAKQKLSELKGQLSAVVTDMSFPPTPDKSMGDPLMGLEMVKLAKAMGLPVICQSGGTDGLKAAKAEGADFVIHKSNLASEFASVLEDFIGFTEPKQLSKEEVKELSLELKMNGLEGHYMEAAAKAGLEPTPENLTVLYVQDRYFQGGKIETKEKPKVRFLREVDWIFTNAFLSPTPGELEILAVALQKYKAGASIAEALVSVGRTTRSKEKVIYTAVQKIEVE